MKIVQTAAATIILHVSLLSLCHAQQARFDLTANGGQSNLIVVAEGGTWSGEFTLELDADATVDLTGFEWVVRVDGGNDAAFFLEFDENDNASYGDLFSLGTPPDLTRFVPGDFVFQPDLDLMALQAHVIFRITAGDDQISKSHFPGRLLNYTIRATDVAPGTYVFSSGGGDEEYVCSNDIVAFPGCGKITRGKSVTLQVLAPDPDEPFARVDLSANGGQSDVIIEAPAGEWTGDLTLEMIADANIDISGFQWALRMSGGNGAAFFVEFDENDPASYGGLFSLTTPADPTRFVPGDFFLQDDVLLSEFPWHVVFKIIGEVSAGHFPDSLVNYTIRGTNVPTGTYVFSVGETSDDLFTSLAASGTILQGRTVTLQIIGPPPPAQLVYSTSPDRSNPLPLGGKSVEGDIYVIVNAPPATNRVEFWIDNPSRLGNPIHIDTQAPFDLLGSTGAFANPLNTVTLAQGPHSVTAVVHQTDGPIQVIETSFIVNNPPAELAFTPALLSISIPQGQTRSLTAELVANTGVAGFTLTKDADWLGASPATGITPATVTLVIDTASLVVGPYTATVEARSEGLVSAALQVELNVTTPPPAENPMLRFSTSADRSNPSLLDGSTLFDEVYVFVAPDTSVSRVVFWMDDPDRLGGAVTIDDRPPFDLFGEFALPLNTHALANGAHSITAEIRRTNGSTDVLHADYTVDNPITGFAFTPTIVSDLLPLGVTVTRTAQLMTANGAAVDFQITDDADWLTVTPVVGATPATVTLLIDTTSLASGNYEATVTAVAPGLPAATLLVDIAVRPILPPGEHELRFSYSPDRRGADLLQGETVAGDIYAFVSGHNQDIETVDFFVDNPNAGGKPFQREGRSPFDLAGTDGDDGKPFDTRKLDAGLHTVTAKVLRKDGDVVVLHAEFAVDQGTPALLVDKAVISLELRLDQQESVSVSVEASDGASVPYEFGVSLGGDDWLQVSSATGVTPDTLTIDIDTTTLLHVTSKRPRIVLEAEGYEPVVVLIRLTIIPDDPAALFVSTSPDRSLPLLLHGATIAGDVAVFVMPESGIRRMEFFIDDPLMEGPPFHSEGRAPYDLLGGSAGAANLFDTSTLSEGPHTITAAIRFSSGQLVPVHAEFTVDHGAIIESTAVVMSH